MGGRGRDKSSRACITTHKHAYIPKSLPGKFHFGLPVLGIGARLSKKMTARTGGIHLWPQTGPSQGF